MMYYGFGIDSESIRTEELAIGLDGVTVAEIKELIDRLELPLKKSARKQALVDAVSALLIAHPEYLVDRMSGAEISVLRRLIAGERIIGDYRVLTTFYFLVKVGWIALKQLKGSDYIYEMILREEAERVLRPLLTDSVPSLHARIMQFIDGWAAMCGILPVDVIVNHIKKQPGFEDATYADVMDTLMDYAEANHLIHDRLFNSGRGDIIYISLWCNIVGKTGLLLTKYIDDNGKKVQVNAYDPVEFSYEEIMDASIPLFAPQTPNTAECNRFRALCLKKGLDASRADELLLDAWIEKQQDNNSRNLSKILCRFNFQTIDEVNEITATITDYMNTLPFWRFLGCTSKEMAAKELESSRAPRLVAGPNMRAMGMDIPVGLQEEFDSMWAALKPTAGGNTTVGRNDPCPCGSGKKYKKCCGK